MGETEEKYEKSQSVSGPRFESGISRAYAYLVADPEHRFCVSHSFERSLQADSIDILFLSEKKKSQRSLLCPYTSSFLATTPITTTCSSVLIRPSLFFFLLLLLTCPRSSVNGPTTTLLKVRECSGIFGHVHVACQPRAASGTIGGYLKRCRQMLLPPPPLTQPLPNGTPISPRYSLVVLSATFPFSKCQQGVTIAYLPTLYLRQTRTW